MNIIPNTLKRFIIDGTVSFQDDELRLVLLDDNHSQNQDTQRYLSDVVQNEISSSGDYVASSQTSAGNTVVNGADNHQQRFLEKMLAYHNWLNGHETIISEFAIANNDDDTKYIAMANKFFEVVNLLGYNTAVWAVGDYWESDNAPLYPLLPFHGKTMADLSISAPFNANKGPVGNRVHMINLAGGEFGLDADANGNIGSLSIYNYTYHIGSSTWQNIKDKGYTAVRFPFRLERIFTIAGAFKVGARQELLDVCAEARAVGLKILWDPHNYAAFQENNTKQVLSGSQFTTARYNTMMNEISLIATENADVTWGVNLINEPKNLKTQRKTYANQASFPSTGEGHVLYHDLSNNNKFEWNGSTYQSPSEGDQNSGWEEIAQGAVNSMRASGYEGLITVSTGNWQGLQDAPGIHPDGPFITDSLNNFMYDSHTYFDDNFDGDYSTTYAQDEAGISGYTPSNVTFPAQATESFGGVQLQNKTISVDNTNDRAVFDASDISIGNSSITARYAVIYAKKNTFQDSPIIAIIDFNENKVSDGGSQFTITWDTSGIIHVS